MHDIIIIGGGPAGLTAALYALRADKSVLIIEKGAFGGQITFSPLVENYPAVPSASGNAIAEKLVDQVLSQGADIEIGEVKAVKNAGDVKTVVADCGEYDCKSVIIAAGARHRTLGLSGEEALIGHGISFCAVCDGAFYKDRRVGVVGGGNSALQEALLLAELAERVTLIQNLPYLTGEKRLCERVEANEKIEISCSTVVSAVNGEGELSSVTLRDEATGKERELPLDGLFVAIGLLPQNEPFADMIDLTAQGYADSGEDCRTRTSGVFVAGDCRRKKVRQVTTAVADGATAALAACEYIDGK